MKAKTQTRRHDSRQRTLQSDTSRPRIMWYELFNFYFDQGDLFEEKPFR